MNRIKIALESGAVPYVIRESERIAHLIPDFTSFEQECYWRIGKALLAFRDNGREKKALIQKIIRSVRADFLTGKKRRIRYDTSFEGEDGTVWKPEDISANVVSEVLLKEKIALLAQDDPRKKTIGTEDAQTIRKFHRFWRSDLEEIPSLTVSSSNGSGHTANPN